MKGRSVMYISDDIKKELDYFKRLHEHYSIQAGEKQISVKNADEKILYILMSASYAMDIFEEGFFENFVLTDKALTNKQELLQDASMVQGNMSFDYLAWAFGMS